MATLTRLIASAQELAELQSSLHYADHVLNETRIRFTNNSDMTLMEWEEVCGNYNRARADFARINRRAAVLRGRIHFDAQTL